MSSVAVENQTKPNLFTPVKLGVYTLPNRIVMAPMSRLRAIGGVPQPVMATYYAQRASAGLTIAESTMISPLSNNYMNCPGIYSPEQVKGWRQVTEAVHDRGGRIFLQLWHCGRIAHSSLLNGEMPIAPSAIALYGEVRTPIGKKALETPRVLKTHEIPEIVGQFRKAAENAMVAGFDGVELHGACGFLIDQFLQDSSNQRTDKYGGAIKNRARFLLEVVESVASVWGGDRVGIRLSPSHSFYGMSDSNPKATFSYVIQELNRFNLAYLHLMEPHGVDFGTREIINPVLPVFRPLYKGTIITNGGYEKANGNAVLASGEANLVAFGKLFLANPDLPKRLELDAPLNPPDYTTFYGPDENGYTDYPCLEDLN